MTELVFFFFFKQKTAYELLRSLVGSEMCIRDSLEVLEAERIPLFIDPSSSMVVGERDLTDWDALVPVSYTHLTLPTIYSV